MLEMIETVVPALAADRPRYLMGVGTPDDLLKSLRVASTCSTASCRPVPDGTEWSSPAAGA